MAETLEKCPKNEFSVSLYNKLKIFVNLLDRRLTSTVVSLRFDKIFTMSLLEMLSCFKKTPSPNIFL